MYCDDYATRFSPLALFTFILSGVILFANCSYLVVGSRTVDKKIEVEELHGRWRFNEFTLDGIQRLRSLGLTKLSADENTIEIRKDGTCQFNSFTSFHPYGYHLSSEGTWSLKKGHLEIIGETSYIELELRPGGNRVIGTTFYLKRRGSNLVMYDFIDDPDQNQFVEFERESQ